MLSRSAKLPASTAIPAGQSSVAERLAFILSSVSRWGSHARVAPRRCWTDSTAKVLSDRLDCPEKSSNVWAMDEQPKPDVDERREDQHRRRSEAVDVLAETLLAMWLHEQRARRAMRLSPAAEARPPEQGSTPSTQISTTWATASGWTGCRLLGNRPPKDSRRR